MTNQESTSTSDEPAPEPIDALSLTREDIERIRAADDVFDLPEHPDDVPDPHDPVGCPLCGGSGQVPSMLPELLQPAHDRETCPKCAGIGMVLSGSRIPEHMIQACSNCNGSGFVAKAPTFDMPAPPAAAAAPPAPPPPEPAPFVMPVVTA